MKTLSVRSPLSSTRTRVASQAAVAMLAVCLPSHACHAGEPMVVPFLETFANGALAPEWKVSASKGNTIGVEDGLLKISALVNTHANIQRPLGVDNIRATCMLRHGGGVTWANALTLYWNDGNWCKITVLKEQNTVYTAESIGDAYYEHFSPIAATAPDWQYAAIELGDDCVRYQYSLDGKTWQTVRLSIRTDDWKGAPRLLIVGKAFTAVGDDHSRAAPELNNDYSDPGLASISWVREISVSPTPPERLQTPAAEFEQFRPGRDKWGEEELAAPADPSFVSVIRHFPPLGYPREVVGVKDAHDEIIVLPDGSLQIDTADYEQQYRGQWNVTSLFFEVGEPAVRLSAGQEHWRKRLLEGYLPIVVATHEHEGLRYEQTAFGWSPSMSPDVPGFGYVRLTVSNPGAESRKIALRLRTQRVKETTVQDAARWDLDVPAGGSQSVWVSTPLDAPAQAVVVASSDFDARLAETRAWWEKLLSKATRIRVPEQRINDAYRAWLAYSFLNVDKHGDVYEPHDGGGFYEAVFAYSAARYCNAIDLMGYHQDAERYMDALMTYIRPDGMLNVNFGIMDAGALLDVMGEHYRLTADEAWLRRVAPVMLKMCNWIIQERQKATSALAKDSPLYGLIKGQPYCDHPSPAYSYLTDCSFVAGMESAADALGAIGMADEANRLRAESESYRADILASMSRTPIEKGGIRILPMFPETHELIKVTSYVAKDYYTLVAGMLLETGFLRSSDEPTRLIREFLERRGGLLLGMCAFSNGIDHAYTYGYWRDCLERDDIKRVLLGFYGSLAYGMSRDTYAAVECASIADGRNPNTLPDNYSNAQQLRLLRNMLLREQEGRLLIGQAIPRAWLEQGKQIRVEDAPTLFGKTTFTIDSNIDQNRIVVTLEPPVRNPPEAIVLRLRHPAGLPIKAVSVGGAPIKDFAEDTITLTGVRQPVAVEVQY